MKIFKPWQAILFLFISSSLYAADDHVSINFYGVIGGASCDISSDSENIPVYIGAFTTATFPSEGSVSPTKTFNITLQNCSSSTKTAEVTFTGTLATSSDTSLLALQDTAGTGNMASGVAVQLLDSTGNPLPINTLSGSYPISNATTVLPFGLRYKSISTTVTPGEATSVMYFDIDYQ